MAAHYAVAFGSFNNKNEKEIYTEKTCFSYLKKKGVGLFEALEPCHGHEQAGGQRSRWGPHFQTKGLGPLLRPLLRPFRRCPHCPRTGAPLVETCPDLPSSLFQARACSFKMSFPPTFYQIKCNPGRTLPSQGFLLSCWGRINGGWGEP